MSGKLYAGVSTVDISPGQGIGLAGYPHLERANTGIHDPLYASCIYLDNGETKLAIVTMDLVKYSKKHVRAIRNKAWEKYGIPPGNIMICCSHTHSGPLTGNRLDMEGVEKGIEPDSRYMKQLEEKLDCLIGEASTKLFEARIGVEKGYCGKEQGVGGNRNDPGGLSDPEVCVIGVKDGAGRWRACLVEYALHPTFIHGDSTVVSADYPCYIRRYLADTKPGITVLFAQGTSGNQSSRYFRSSQSFAEAERVGRAIGREADRVLDAMELSAEAGLFVKSVETEIDLKELPPKEKAMKDLDEARKFLDGLKASNAPYVAIRNAEVKVFGMENILGYVNAAGKSRGLKALSDEMPVEIQVIGIGNARIAGIQGELFVEYGLKIKAGSPFGKTLVIELANGALPGYVCTAEAHANRTYEAGTSLMTAKTGEILVDATLKLIGDSISTLARLYGRSSICQQNDGNGNKQSGKT